MNNIEVDARQVVSMFADLTSRQQRQVYRSALRKGAGILVGETKRQLRQTLGRAASSRNWWNGRTLVSLMLTEMGQKLKYILWVTLD